MTLKPGDVIFTGAPGGVGAAMDPRQFLNPGDLVRCEIDRIGAIEAVMQLETCPPGQGDRAVAGIAAVEILPIVRWR